MKAILSKPVAIGLGAAAMLMATVAGAAAATPEEVAKCQKMIKEMGAPAPHSHGAEKGQGPAPMSAEHARCNAILAEANKDKKK